MRIKWTEPALEDALAIQNYIKRDSPYYAQAFIEKLMTRVELLETPPMMGRIVPEYQMEHLREIVFHTFRIIYSVTDDAVFILTIIHGARNLENTDIDERL